MKIRAVTLGVREDGLAEALPAAHEARKRLQDAGYEILQLRLALSFPKMHQHDKLVNIAMKAEQQAIEAGFDYVSIGRIPFSHMSQVNDALAATTNTCCSGRIAGRDGSVSLEGIRASAETILAISHTLPYGEANMRFAALAGVGPGSPFFPSSYHDGGNPWIAIGPEAATLGHQALDEQPVQESAFLEMSSRLTGLTKLIEQHDRHIQGLLRGLDSSHKVFVTGCDWSITCGISENSSVGSLIEKLSGVPFGAMGTLVALGELNKAIRAARVNLIGFSSLMLPLLGDEVLSQRNMQEPPTYALRDLISFSGAYGIGPDTVPLPGDTTVEQLIRILSEVASLSGTLRRPLVARLFPIPGLKARDMIDFHSLKSPIDSAYTTYTFPTRVMTLL